MGYQIAESLSGARFIHPDRRLWLRRDTEMIEDVIARRNLDKWGSKVVYAEGRNIYLDTQDPLMCDDHARRYIQLSGGFYKPFALHTNGIGINGNGDIDMPSEVNFVTGREYAFTTAFVTEAGLVVEEKKLYSPTGGYTREQAEHKAANTRMMTSKTEPLFGSLSKPWRPIIVPEVVDIYAMEDRPDINGKPICGIAMLVPKPDTRFGIGINAWMKNNVPNPDLLSYIQQGSDYLKHASYHMAKAARYLHDQIGKTHGQMTLGNGGLMMRNPFNRGSGEAVYLADWDTVKDMPKNIDAFILARALELATLWMSTRKVMQVLLGVREDVGSNSDFFYLVSSTGILGAILRGYKDSTAFPQVTTVSLDETLALFTLDTPQSICEGMRDLLLREN